MPGKVLGHAGPCQPPVENLCCQFGYAMLLTLQQIFEKVVGCKQAPRDLCQYLTMQCNLKRFWTVQARAHLLNVGIIRPREDVSAIDINAFLSRPEGAPPSVGRIADPDKIDIARFLNRREFRSAVLHSSSCMLICFAASQSLKAQSCAGTILCVGHKAELELSHKQNKAWTQKHWRKAKLCRYHGRHVCLL